MIFIDSISQQHFLRSLPLTTKFLKKFIGYKNKNGFATNEFLKYHTFRPYTDSNVFPMFFGNRQGTGKGINILKYFKEQGYITATSGSYGDKEIFGTNMRDKFLYNMEITSFDHENIALFIDRNNFRGSFRGPNSITRKCLY